VKLIIFVLVIVVGSAITALIDSVLGINQLFQELPAWKEVIHKATYMIWGTILLCVMWRLKITNEKRDLPE